MGNLHGLPLKLAELMGAPFDYVDGTGTEVLSLSGWCSGISPQDQSK